MSDTSTKTNEEKPQSDWQKRECGALWLRQSPSQQYFSGHVVVADEFGVEKKLKVVIFSNKHKKKDNHPDFRVYRSEPQDQTKEETPQVPESVLEETEVEEELI